MPRLLILVLMALIVISGCSNRPRRVPISGKVTIDGQPLTTGFVQVIPDKARPAVGEIDAAGNYQLETYGAGDGCVLGTHRVAVIAMQALSPTKKRWLAPIKYRDPGTSGLTIEVDRPRNDMEIKLTWDGAAPFIEETQVSQGDKDPTKL